jgi:hypothetical protein
MPFDGTAIRIDLACGPLSDGRWRGWHSVKIRAGELRRLGIRPFPGPGRPGRAGMSLAVSVYVGGEKAGEPLAAGFENWRTQVWGSPRVRALGAVYFPELAERDLRAAAGEVAAFLRECALLREHLNAITGAVDLSGQPGTAVDLASGSVTAVAGSREVFREQVSQRLANIEAAASRALFLGGEVIVW